MSATIKTEVEEGPSIAQTNIAPELITKLKLPIKVPKTEPVPPASDEDVDDTRDHNREGGNNQASCSDEIRSRKRRRVHPVWEEFEERDGKIWCKIKGCGRPLQGNSKTTVMKRHLESAPFLKEAHRKVFNSVQEQEKMQSGALPKKPKAKQQPPIVDLLRTTYGPGHPKQLRSEKALVRLLSNPGLSIDIFTHSAIKEFVYTLDPKIQLPTSNNGLKELLSNEAEKAKEALKKKLESCTVRPSITTDIWTKSMKHSYLAATIHYLAENALTTAFLGIYGIRERRTGGAIREFFDDCLAEYNLNKMAINKIVTDNGFNMIKAFGEPTSIGYSEPDDEDEEEEDNFANDLDNSLDEELSLAFPKRVPCFTHALQSTLMVASKDLEECEGFKCMSQLIGQFKHSADATRELKEATNKTPISPSKTRWGLYTAVIGRFIELEEELRRISALKKWPFPSLGDVEFLLQVYFLLSPFCEALATIQAEKSVTISQCYGIIKALLHSLDDFEENGTIRIQEMAKLLRKDLDERFAHVMDVKNIRFEPSFIISTALDPRTANDLDRHERRTAAAYFHEIVNSGVSDDVILPQPIDPKSALGRLLAQMQAKNQMTSSQKSLGTSIDECFDHIASIGNCSIDPIGYWREIRPEWAKLKKFALEILIIPATSAPVERVFSQTGLATNLRRNLTGLGLLNNQLMVYLNREH